MAWLVWTVAGLIGTAVAVVGAGHLGAFSGQAPADLGVRDGRLRPPSTSPNSVSSQARLHAEHPRRDAAQIDPLALRGSGPQTIAALERIVAAMPGAALVERRDDYLYARFTTRWMRFVDDLECWFDPVAGVVQVRSASRVGESDLGVNRARVEAIRAALAAAPATP